MDINKNVAATSDKNSRRPIMTVKDLDIFVASQTGDKSVVKNLNFAIHQNETFAIVGGSGSGKSLTALAMMQLLGDEFCFGKKSQILLHDNKNTTDLLQLSEKRLRKYRGASMAMIFQEPMTSLNPVLTIERQITEVLYLHEGLNARAARTRSVELLHAVGITRPQHCAASYPHQLSGGMKQRVMIAIALAGRPDLLIADEPTTALDVTIARQVVALLKDLQQQFKMAILFITHDLAIVSEIADTVAVMHEGTFIEQAAIQTFLHAPQHPYSQKLLQFFKPEASLISEYARFHRDPPQSCHPRECGDDRLALKLDTPLLQITDLSVYFPIKKGLLRRTVDHIKAVDDVSLTVYPGETVAIVGESGSGKTTLARTVLQLETARHGTIVFKGQNIAEVARARNQALRREIQMVFQDPYASLDPRMRVFDIIAEGLRTQKILPSETAIRERVAFLLERVGMQTNMQHRYPHEFSGGQRQRIAIARAIALSPTLLVCDEPTSALDIFVQAQILDLFRALQREMDLAYLFITHNLNVVAQMADRVAVMHLGRIVEQGPVSEVLRAPKHPYTRTLLESCKYN